MKPIFFKSPEEFRKWLEKNHLSETELYVGFYKKHTGQPSMTWSESVDQALCFGWIDGIRKSIDEKNYQIRFTPRKPKSNWSAVNIRKIEELTKLGLMQQAGLAVFSLREEKRSEIYTYERKPHELSPEFAKKFRANKKAWTYFQAMAPGYKKHAIDWVMRAVKEETSHRRIATLIKDSEDGRKIRPLSYDKKPKAKQ